MFFIFSFFYVSHHANAMVISEGGPILYYLYPKPCINLPPPAFATLKFSNNIGAIPVIYPYWPGVITKLNYFPAEPGLTELGLAISNGVCIVLVPCPVGSCPYPIYGYLSTMHGNAFQQ